MEAELGVGYAIQEEGVYSCVRVEIGRRQYSEIPPVLFRCEGGLLVGSLIWLGVYLALTHFGIHTFRMRSFVDSLLEHSNQCRVSLLNVV